MPGNNGCVAADGAAQVSGITSPSDNEYRTKAKALPAFGNKLNLSPSPIKFQKAMNARPTRHPSRKGMTLKLPGLLVILAGLPISGLVSIFSHPVKAEEETTIVLNTTGNAPLNTPDQQGFVDLVATEAFQRIGVRVKTVKLPAERGLINANQGIHDGEMLRVGGLDKIYHNLVMVPEVSNALQQMKVDGSYQKIVDRILTPLKPSQ